MGEMAQMSRFPGFRFCPTDVELISYYLKQKMDGSEKSVEVIPEVEICRYEPWDLPGKAVIQSDNEWFFFSPRGRKYPSGSQSKRATECGYWKATGKERSVKSNTNVIGTKRTLVFHLGRAPKGQRTEWIMHEYCMHGSCQDPMVVCRMRKNSEFRLNEESASQRGLSMASKNTNQAAGPPSHHQYSQMSGNDHIDGERANDGSSKKCTSSHDSYSIEQSGGDTFESDCKVPHDTSQQRDDGFESDHNVPHDASQPESPCCRKDCDNDDFYAEILNDDIVKLFDESSLTTSQNSQPVISRRTEQHHMRSASPSMVPSQGTARRRIRFDTSKVDLDHLEKHLNPPEPQSIVSRLKAASLSSILVLVLLIVAPLVALPMVSRIQPALLFARIQSKNNN